MSTQIDRISELAKEDAKRQFYSIGHMITPESLYAAFRGLRKKASAGVDGVTYEEYERDVARNIQTLHERLKNGKYQAQPLRRVYIPKENGKQRPISIPALEDKIVQKGMVEILHAIYEQDFLDCSYGFRPGRGQHQALDEVGRVICTRPTGWVLEIDVTAYFDSIVREQLMEMIEKRVRDRSVLRLIRKWIQVGVIEEGRLLVSETGTGQGQTISPLLANIYLHYVLDEWFENEVKPRLRGAAHEIRFADDAVLCFQYKEDAERVMEVLPKRFTKYGLTIHPEKTRLLEFGRYAEEKAKRQGKKPATFDFLGYTHVCARSRRGKFTVHVRTMKKRFRRGLTAIAEWCQENRHMPVEEQQKTLNAKLRGHYQYYGRPTNYQSLWRFFREVRHIWQKGLSRRTRGNGMTWEKYAAILRKHPLLLPRIQHSWNGPGSHV
ncbi:MAG TPA: group II intron reverse transcriptase/maturase [Candidatus Sulfotelmatobacter sp.]|jgi:RNA-directed DNA polymerase|nr:group II intron reverse transcriptase/maturase [Candidatus Sulfotelmatobacter sp.]